MKDKIALMNFDNKIVSYVSFWCLLLWYWSRFQLAEVLFLGFVH